MCGRFTHSTPGPSWWPSIGSMTGHGTCSHTTTSVRPHLSMSWSPMRAGPLLCRCTGTSFPAGGASRSRRCDWPPSTQGQRPLPRSQCSGTRPRGGDASCPHPVIRNGTTRRDRPRQRIHPPARRGFGTLRQGRPPTNPSALLCQRSSRRPKDSDDTRRQVPCDAAVCRTSHCAKPPSYNSGKALWITSTATCKR
jgi:hypothetical protein